MVEPSNTLLLSSKEQLQQDQPGTVESNKAKQIKKHPIKDRIHYFFFLVSFLAVIIFSMAPLLSNVLSGLAVFAKVIIPLVLYGAFFGYLGTNLELDLIGKLSLFGKSITIRKYYNLYISDIIFIVILSIELSFLWDYFYL